MRRPRGFSLVEIAVSVFIMSVMMLILQAVTHSSVLVRMSKSQGIALAIARNKIETLRAAGYAAIPSSGPVSDALLSSLPPSATATLTVSAYNAKTKQVSIRVEWRDAVSAASSTVSLSTLVTQTGALP